MVVSWASLERNWKIVLSCSWWGCRDWAFSFLLLSLWVLLAVEIVSVRKLQQSGVRRLFLEVTRTVFFLLPLGKLCHLSFQRKIKIETHCSIFSSLKIACRYQHCFKFWVLPFLEGHLQILDKNFWKLPAKSWLSSSTFPYWDLQ